MSVGERLRLEQRVGSSQDDELTHVLADYLAEVEAGRPVDLEEWIEKHPAIAERLRTCLHGLQMVEDFAGSIGAAGIEEGSADDGPTLGDFRIVRSLGRGGMGIVYEAVQASLGRHVALKVLPFGAAIDPRRLARFRVESQAAAQLHHAHIIPVYSVGCERGVHYYAMQLIDGTTLAEVITELRRSKPSASTAVHATNALETSSILSTSAPSDSAAYCRAGARLGLQAALALDHAHENGVLHRDVKPSNLMVDGSGHLWVADFGLARFRTDSSLTVSGDILGTLAYMSPEQALANRDVVDQRTDVYSLGATLYELLTLRAPFEGSNRQELLRKIAQDEPRGPRVVRPGIPLDLETIILKAMAKDVASRYSTAGEMADDLNRFLDDQPIRARRPKVLERLTRLARKHTAIVMAVMPLLIVIVAGLSLGVLLFIAKQAQIRTKRIEAERSHADARRQRNEARRAVDEMYTLVAQNWLSQQTKLQPLQRDFLEKALLYYQEFASAEDADPSIRAAAAWAFYRMGAIERRLGNLEAGERGFRHAIDTFEGLGKGEPLGPDLLEPLADSYAGLGELLDESGRAEESAKVLDRSIELRRVLIRFIPETATNFSILATRYEELGTSLARNGRNKESEEAYKKATALGNASAEPNTLTQARSISNLAAVLQKQGRLGEAERLYRKAIEEYERLATANPGVPLYRSQLADSLLNLGQALSRDSKETEPIFRRAVEAYTGLVTEAPNVSQYRNHLATTLLSLASLCFNAGRLREAELAARQARILFETLLEETPNLVLNQEGLARSLAWLGKIRGRAGQTATALADAKLGRDLYDKLNPKASDIRSERAWNIATVAQLQELSGDPREADKSWRQAVAQFDLLATEDPGRLDIRSDLAYQVMSLALSSARIGLNADAERHYHRALDILERLVAGAPERSQDRYRLALAQHHFSSFLFQTKRFEESERLGRLAFKSYERLFFENYQQDLMIRNCAACMKNIATVQIGLGLPDAAVNSYVEALKLFDSLPAKLARDPDVREARADILDNAGAIYLHHGRFKDAEPRIRQGLSIRESLTADKPDAPKYQEALGMSKIHLGKVMAKRGELAEARRLLEGGVELETRALKAEPRNWDARRHLQGGRKALATFLLDEGIYADSGIICEALLRDHSSSDGIETLMEVAAFLIECADLAMSDANLPPGDRESTALAYARKSLELFKKTAESKTDNAGIINLAWCRLTCPVAELRDFDEAQRLARELTSRSPERADSWTILGASRYHRGDYQGSLSAFQKARELTKGKFGFWDFYVAMAHWQLGQKPEAQASFERAAGWMKGNQANRVHRHVHAQAASVLNLPDPGPPSRKRQEK